ncbi:MAG: AI-2E family transporter [Calditrichia bacterium]
MFFDQEEYTLDRVVRLVLGAVALVVGLLLIAYLQDVLIPFAVALLLAYLINPLVKFMQKYAWLKRRGVAVVVSLLTVFSAITGIVGLIIPLIMAQFSQMRTLLTGLLERTDLDERALQYLPDDIWQYIKDFAVRDDVRDFFNAENLTSAGNILIQRVFPGIWDIFSGTLNIVISIIGLAIVLLYLVFILIDYDEVAYGWKKLIHPKYSDQIVGFVDDFSKAMSRYFRAQAVVASIVGVLFAIGFGIIGLPMGILLGLFIGLLNMVPYLQTLGILPAAFFALMHSLQTETSFWFMMGLVLLVFVIVQAFQDGFLVPRIMGDVTGMNPAVILLSLSVWGKLLGILGLIIALPITFLLSTYYERFLRKARQSV